LVHRLNSAATGRLDADLGEPLHEEGAILGVADRRHRRAKHAYGGASQDPVLLEREPAVERRLPAEPEEELVTALPLDHALHEGHVDREEIGRARHAVVGLDRRYVGVDEDRRDPLLAQRLDRLAAGVIELARLPYLERARAEDQHLAWTVD